MDLNYLMTSEFNEGLTPEQLIELLHKFRYEYRLLSGKNTSLTKELEKKSLELENIKGLNFEIENKSNVRIAILEDEVYFLRNKLTRKLTIKERFIGKIKG